MADKYRLPLLVSKPYSVPCGLSEGKGRLSSDGPLNRVFQVPRIPSPELCFP